jgi:hypothetical protein
VQCGGVCAPSRGASGPSSAPPVAVSDPAADPLPEPFPNAAGPAKCSSQGRPEEPATAVIRRTEEFLNEKSA